jgi:hypothetical protein
MRAGLALTIPLGILLGAGAASAQTQTATAALPVSGNTPQVCAVRNPTLAPGAQINFLGLSGNTLQIDRMVDSTTLSTSAASVDVRFNAVCNYPHRLRLESQNNGLWQTGQITGTPPAGFGTAVPYRAAFSWGSVNGELDTDAQSRRIADQRFNIDNATAGMILLHISIAPGASNLRSNAPLLAGYYSDTLRIFVEPQ